MGQTVTVECQSCESIEKEEYEAVIVFGFRKGASVNMIRHEACVFHYLEAIRFLCDAIKEDACKPDEEIKG